MSKKVLWTIIAVVAVVAIAVVAFVFLNPTNKNVEGSLEEIMAKVYAGIPEENLPSMLGNIQIDSENAKKYLGTTEISYKEAIVSESMTGSIAHSVALVRLNDAKDANVAVEKIKENIDPRRWVCVEASNVAVKSKGDLVILIMADTEMTSEEEALAPRLEANFDNL